MVLCRYILAVCDTERSVNPYFVLVGLYDNDCIGGSITAIWEQVLVVTTNNKTLWLCHVQLGQGVLVQVPSSLIKRCKTHFHNLPCGATVIFGHNGYIWLCPTISDPSEVTGGFVQNLQVSDIDIVFG